MDKPELLEVVSKWSYWNRPIPASIPRRVASPKELRPGLCLVVQGVRRCGKSTLLTQLLSRYQLDPQRCAFVNFEDPGLAGALEHRTLDLLVESFDELRGTGAVYFLDEVQHVEGWERWLRSQLDREKDRRFVITGSNASLLSGELGSSLTGRHLSIELFPFDLDEYRELRPDATLESFLYEGGFPAPLELPDGDQLRRSYFNDIVERDVRARVGARSAQPLRRLAQMLFESAGAEFSLRRVASSLGIAPDTASLYLDALETCYLAFACPFFTWSERKRSECAVFVELRKRFGEVYYWRGKGEVDFVVLKDNAPLPIQVTWDHPLPRHDSSLGEFYEEHPRAHEAVYVTAESFETGLVDLI
jgi:predicted AAA+ superfamily ATPase